MSSANARTDTLGTGFGDWSLRETLSSLFSWELQHGNMRAGDYVMKEFFTDLKKEFKWQMLAVKKVNSLQIWLKLLQCRHTEVTTTLTYRTNDVAQESVVTKAFQVGDCQKICESSQYCDPLVIESEIKVRPNLSKDC